MGAPTEDEQLVEAFIEFARQQRRRQRRFRRSALDPFALVERAIGASLRALEQGVTRLVDATARWLRSSRR